MTDDPRSERVIVTPFMDAFTISDEAREAADAKAAADRTAALSILHGRFRDAGVPADAIEAVMPAIDAMLHPRIERMHGVLSEAGILTPVYAYANPFASDPEFPGWQDYEDAAAAAREAARDYTAVRLSTGWIEDTP